MNDIKAAARAGDTKALAQLMNQSFGPKGINVKVAKSGSVLKVLMECDRLPDRKLAGAVRKGIDGIKPAGVEKVFLKAQSGGAEDSWIEQWSLSQPQPVAKPSPVSQPAKAQPNTGKSFQMDTSANTSQIVGALGFLAIFGGISWVVFGGGLGWIFDDGQTDFDAVQTTPSPTPSPIPSVAAPEVPAFQPVRCGWVDGSITRDNTGAAKGKVICNNNNATAQPTAITVVACAGGLQKGQGYGGGTIGQNSKAEIDWIILNTEPSWTYYIAEPNGEYCPQE